MHSQRLREKALTPWLIAEKCGKILATHCDCMAGLAETCTHVAAVLFFIEATVKIRDARTVTQDPAYWLLPKSVKNVSYNEMGDIDFSSPKAMKKRLDTAIEENVTLPSSNKNQRKIMIIPPSESEFNKFLKELYDTGEKPVILSIVEEFSDSLVPKIETKKLPIKLTSLKTDVTLKMNFKDLVDYCSDIDIKILKEEAENVEAVTRAKSASKLWFNYRAGRLTASNMKAICSTNPSNPSQRLIKNICYPNNFFQNEATRWGIQKEQEAGNQFIELYLKQHQNVLFHNSGLLIYVERPYIAASPDGVIQCSCCGESCVEIKSPFSRKSCKIDDSIPYLKVNQGQLQLDRNHSYYYQIQTQLGVSKLLYCYFVVWTTVDMFVEKIQFNDLLWSTICLKTERIFKTAVLPELVGKLYSRLAASEVPNFASKCSCSESKDSSKMFKVSEENK